MFMFMIIVSIFINDKVFSSKFIVWYILFSFCCISNYWSVPVWFIVWVIIRIVCAIDRTPKSVVRISFSFMKNSYIFRVSRYIISFCFCFLLNLQSCWFCNFVQSIHWIFLKWIVCRHNAFSPFGNYFICSI